MGTSAKTFVDSNRLIHAHDVDQDAAVKVEARRVVATYMPWCLEPEAGDVGEAFRIEDEAGISFRDALIVAAAARGGATSVLSEDLNHGQFLSGVTVIDPFEESGGTAVDAGRRAATTKIDCVRARLTRARRHKTARKVWWTRFSPDGTH